jgi:hypothetical protein
MPRPRKPTAILELSGSFKKNPQRRAERDGEPTPAGPIGTCPRDLADEVRAAWGEIVRTCPPGVLTKADRIAVRSAARLLAAENAGSIAVGERAQLHKLLGDLGMTPRGRAYVHVPPPSKTGNEFADV